MYGVGPSVANVTANGEEIVSVTEVGLSNICEYEYNNGKTVEITVDKGNVVGIEIYFISTSLDGEINIDNIYDYEILEDIEKNKYLTDLEKDLLVKDAVKRYEMDHVVYKKRNKCNFL